MDDPFFDRMSQAQMLWIIEQLNTDKQQESEEKIMFADYIASFINSEAVKKIKQAREMKKERDSEEPEEFISRAKEQSKESTDLLDVIKKYRKNIETPRPEATNKISNILRDINGE